MEIKTDNWPLYSKLSNILVGILAFFYILYIGKEIIVPFLFALIIAILLNPLVNFLCLKKINRLMAITLSVTLAVIIISGLAYFIISQATMLSDTLPMLKQKFITLLNGCVNWTSSSFGIDRQKVEEWLAKTQLEGINSNVMIGTAITTLSELLILFILIPIYIFMILLYKPLLLTFAGQLLNNQQQEMMGDVLAQTKIKIQSYLTGLLIEAAIVAVLNSAALMIVGLKYALLIGVIGALVNIIPYIGGLIATGIPMLMALATERPISALLILILYLIVQVIDNNFIVPRIVASKVQVNALVSIIVVLIGQALWGIAGMFLAIPLIAIIKVIFDSITSLKPFGLLIGDEPKTKPRNKLFSLKFNEDKIIK